MNVLQLVGYSTPELKSTFLRARSSHVKIAEDFSLPSTLTSMKMHLFRTVTAYMTVFHQGSDDFLNDDIVFRSWITSASLDLKSITLIINLIQNELEKDVNFEIVLKMSLNVSDFLCKFGADIRSLVIGLVERSVVKRFARSIQYIKDLETVEGKRSHLLKCFNDLKLFCPIGSAPLIRDSILQNKSVLLENDLMQNCASYALEQLFPLSNLSNQYALSIIKDNAILEGMVTLKHANSSRTLP
ncbi:hypothetical protein ACOME3_007494 [Neoechinorhynchus agilis]